MLITIPEDVKYIIDTFYKNGYEAFMVGGCIRDILLNRTPMDYDIAASAPPEVTMKLFEKTIPTGIEHGTITVLINNVPYEVTTYRTDGTYSDNRKPDSVKFISNIKDDLARRDFTINAFAYNDRKGLLDYFSGNEDLNNKVIRCVGNPDIRFKEDALRMLRAIRFSAQLNFDIDSTTYNAIKNNSTSIVHISKERIRVELSKTLLSVNPLAGIEKLKESGLLENFLPYNLNIDESLNKVTNNIGSRLSCLFLSLDTHLIEKILKELTFDNNTINKVLKLTSSFPIVQSASSKPDCKKLIIKVGENNIFDLINLYESVNNTSLNNLALLIEEISNNNEPLYIKDLAINGNTLIKELNLKPGKILGELLNYLLGMIIDEKVNNTTEELLICAKNYYSK